jgi:hypothetical protein
MEQLAAALQLSAGIVALVGVVVTVVVVLSTGRSRSETNKLLREQNTALRAGQQDLLTTVGHLESQNKEQAAQIKHLDDMVTARDAIDRLGAQTERFAAESRAASAAVLKEVAELRLETAKYHADEAASREGGRRASAEEHQSLLNALEFVTTRLLPQQERKSER